MDRDKDIKAIARMSRENDREQIRFAEIDFHFKTKREVISRVKNDGPVYNPLSKEFYTQRLIWLDPEWGWLIQFDVILIWIIFGGILIWSVFF